MKEDIIMNTALIQILTGAAMILSIIIPMAVYFSGEKTKKRYKKTLAANVAGFFGLMLVVTVV